MNKIARLLAIFFKSRQQRVTNKIDPSSKLTCALGHLERASLTAFAQKVEQARETVATGDTLVI